MKPPEGRQIGEFGGRKEQVEQNVRSLKRGYLRLTAGSRKKFSDGYLFVEEGRTIGSYFFNGSEKWGEEAYSALLGDLEKEPLVTVVELDELKLDMIKEYYPETLFAEPGETHLATYSPPENLIGGREGNCMVGREELLQKYGIMDPSEETIDSIILENIKKESIECAASKLQETIEKEVSNISRVEKARVEVEGEKREDSIRLETQLTVQYSGGLRKKRNPQLEEEVKRKLKLRPPQWEETISEGLGGVKVDIRYSLGFEVKGLV